MLHSTAMATGSSAVQLGADGARPVARPVAVRPTGRFSTRRRLFLAFSALAAVLVVALAFQVAGLRRIEEALAELQDHDDQARLTLELENSIRSQFAHQAHFIVGEDAHLAGYRDAHARSVALITELQHRIDEPGPSAWIEEIRDLTAELDRTFQEKIVPEVLGRRPGAMLLHDKTSTLVSRSEDNIDRIFGFLRDKTAGYHQEVKKLEESTLRLAIVFLAVTPLLALGIALYLSRSIARPLAILGDGAARVAGGDLDTRISIGTADEFGALASEFNAMTSALRDNQEKLVRSEKLASLGRVVAGIAHELNNPLQVMLGYISLDKHRVRGDVAKHLEAVEREVNLCREIVDGLLQLARPAAPVVLASVDLREVADDVASALQIALGEPQPAISVAGQGTASGTHGGFRQIVMNLAKNAAEAAGAGGRVSIEVTSTDSTVDLAVTDSGRGVPPEARERMFEPFFTTKSGGTGLGLSIARAIANGFGGDIEIGSGEEGGGRFTLRLPRARQGGR
jgi:two-component system, NtrC family, sensor kinase